MRYLKNSISRVLLPILVSSLVSLGGCAPKKSADTEAETNIEKVFLKSFDTTSPLGYPVYTSTRTLDKTFWIYIATTKDILTISPASSAGGVTPEKIIKYMEINCDYENSRFIIDYIFLTYSEEEKEKERERNILQKTIGGTMLYQDFTDTAIEILQKTYYAIGDILADSESINFFVINLANIKKGLMVTFIIHKVDMEQFLLNMLPSDEFYNRMIIKTEGNKDIINDRLGLHLEFHDISLPAFIREQIVNHCRAKIHELERYDPQLLEGKEEIDDLLFKNFLEVVDKYSFGDYLFVELNNIITHKKTVLTRSELRERFPFEEQNTKIQHDYSF